MQWGSFGQRLQVVGNINATSARNQDIARLLVENSEAELTLLKILYLTKTPLSLTWVDRRRPMC